MKKISSKIIICILIFLIFCFCIPNCSFAGDGDGLGGKLMSAIMDFLAGICDGIITIVQQAVVGSEGDVIVNIDRSVDVWSIVLAIAVAAITVVAAVVAAPATGGGSLALIAYGVKTVIITIGRVALTYFVVKMATSTMLPTSFNLPFIEVSPESILKNQIEMFDVNFFSPKEPSIESVRNIAYNMKSTIAKWYYSLRTIVIVCFMLVLIYIGIKILITSISEEKAKYKNMLTDWLVSFCLLFVIHYIMIFTMGIVESFTELIGTATENGVEYIDIVDDKVYDYMEELQKNLEPEDGAESETLEEPQGEGEAYSTLYINEEGKKTVRFPVDNFISQARINMQLLREDGGDTYARIGWGVIYVMLTLFTVLYVWIYLKRVVYIAFLILVSPFVVLTYSIDKFRDGQAQGFNTWLKEYIFNLAIQPFHLIIYTVFIGLAMDLASTSPIYVLVILGFMFQAEKILRSMFGFDKAKTPGVLSGALGAGLAMTGMQKFFGRPPHHPVERKNIDNGQGESSGGNSRLGEQDVDDVLPDGEPGDGDSGDGEGTETSLADSAKKLGLEALRKIAPDTSGIDKTDGEVVQDLAQKIIGDDEQEENKTDGAVQETVQELAKKLQEPSTSSGGQNETSTNTSRINSRVKRKAKFKLNRAIKGAARHYAKKTGRRIKDFHPLRNVAGGAVALTAGTAGVLLGAMEGSPEKAFRNAGVLAAAAYKGTTGMIDAGKADRDDMKDSFIKSGYGNDYKLYQQEQRTKEIKNDIENRTVLEDELGWDSKEIKKFFEETMDEYIDAGVRQLDDMIIGEKLKANKVARNTKEALTIMYMGQKIGTDTTKLTEKKKQEWTETFMARSDTMSKVQKQLKQKQKEYDEQIKKIRDKELDKAEENRQIEAVKVKMSADKELNALKKNVADFQKITFGKLDKYSEYKYKE